MKVLTAEGAGWCWFADPRAVWYAGSIYTGWVDMQARVVVAQIEDDPAAGYPTRRFVLSDRSTVSADDVTADDHASPTVMVRNGRVVAFWSGHGGPQMNYRIATGVEDVSAFGPVLNAPVPGVGSYGNTYPNAWGLSDGKVYLTWRASDFQPWITRASSLGAANWEPPRHMISAPAGVRPYVKAVSVGGSTLHVVYTDGHPRDVQTSLFHVKLANNQFKRSDGTVIDTWPALPFPTTDGTRIYDGPSNGTRCWVWDVAISAATGWEPRVLFSVLHSRTEHEYWTARWDGSTWHCAFVAAAGGTVAQDGEDHYSGGGCLDPIHPDRRLWLSVPSSGGVHDLAEYTSPDDGSTWAQAHWLAAPSGEQRVRPVAVRDVPDGLGARLLWMEGPYQTFTDVGARVVLGDPRPPVT